MKVSRRKFFKNLGGLIAASGLAHFNTAGSANASESKPIDQGKVGITWLGHGSFLFTSVKGRKKLLFYAIMELKSLQIRYLNYIMVGQIDVCVFFTLLVNIARQVYDLYNFIVVWEYHHLNRTLRIGTRNAEIVSFRHHGTGCPPSWRLM